jgi:hypothetical protein
MEEVQEDPVPQVLPLRVTEVLQLLLREQILLSSLLLPLPLLQEDLLPRRTSCPTWSACQCVVDLLVEVSEVPRRMAPLLLLQRLEAPAVLLLLLLVLEVLLLQREEALAVLLLLLVVEVLLLQLELLSQ